MESNVSSSGQASARRTDVVAGPLALPLATARRNEIVEPVIFWLFLAALAWTPFWYGSNDLVAWGINAVLFPGLAALYEISILIKGESHPVGIRSLAVPAALFAAVVVWIWVQNMTWAHSPPAHPIWGMAADALGRPLEGSISVNRDLTTLALIRLLTAASVFWVAVQLCRNPARASLFLNVIATIACIYAAYGLIAFASKAWRVPWLEIPSTGGFLSSTFVNRNSFATYAGLGLIAICGLALRLYQRNVTSMAGSRRLVIASLIETTGQSGALLLGGAFVLLVALLLSGSRGGVIATGVGLFVVGVLAFRQGKKRSTKPLETMVLGAILVAATLIAFGDAFVANIAERGVRDTGRMAVYLITLWSIFDAPLLGHGYGTFADVFPMYRDRSISVQGAWEQAHNTYLEVFQGLGLVAGSMLVACVLLLAVRCARGAMTRQENVTVPRVAVGAAFLVGVHALVDFSLQIQAVALTFMAVLGAGVAQSASSRLALND
jgi:O-antigen ligase